MILFNLIQNIRGEKGDAGSSTDFTVLHLSHANNLTDVQQSMTSTHTALTWYHVVSWYHEVERPTGIVLSQVMCNYKTGKNLARINEGLGIYFKCVVKYYLCNLIF